MFQAIKLVSLVRFGEENENPTPEPVADKTNEDVSGLVRKNAELLNDLKKSQASIKRFEAMFQQDEERKAFKTGQLDPETYVQNRLSARDKEVQELIGVKDAETQLHVKRAAELKQLVQDYELKDQIGSIALRDEFFLKPALDDFHAYTKTVWRHDKTGALVAYDASGNEILGKSGGRISKEEWVEVTKLKKPHYWSSPQGSGSRGGHGSGMSISLGDWQRKLATASPEEKTALLAKRQSGEINIQH